MITAVNSINNNQNYVNFEGRKFNMKRFKRRFKKNVKELPYTLGLKKKKTFLEKLFDFFSKKTKSSHNVLTETEPKKDGLFTVLAKDLAERVKKTDEILNS